MRLLHVVHQFLPKYLGGTELYVADLARQLRARGHEVALFAGGDEAARSDWEGLELTTVPGGLQGPRSTVSAFFTVFGNRQAEEAFVDTLRRFQPDVVHFHHLLGLSAKLPLLAKTLGVPTCYTLHDYWFVCPKSQLIDHAGGLCEGPVAGLNCGLCAAQRLGSLAFAVGAPVAAPIFIARQRQVRSSIGSVDVLLAPSGFLARYAARRGLPGEKIAVVDFGAPPLEPAPSQPRQPGAAVRVAYVGSISWSKGVHVLVAALGLLAPGLAEAAVYGDLSAYPDYSRALVRQAEGRPILFPGPVSREGLATALAAADVLAVPSLWYENSPLVVSEAFAAGVPVVASRVGALEEKVRDGVDGLLFSKGDARELAGKLKELATNAGLLSRLRQGVRAEVTRSAHVGHMERIYQGLIKRQPHLEPVH